MLFSASYLSVPSKTFETAGEGTATSVTELMLVDSSSKDVGLATLSKEQQAVNSSVELTGKCLG